VGIGLARELPDLFPVKTKIEALTWRGSCRRTGTPARRPWEGRCSARGSSPGNSRTHTKSPIDIDIETCTNKVFQRKSRCAVRWGSGACTHPVGTVASPEGLRAEGLGELHVAGADSLAEVLHHVAATRDLEVHRRARGHVRHEVGVVREHAFVPDEAGRDGVSAKGSALHPCPSPARAPL